MPEQHDYYHFEVTWDTDLDLRSGPHALDVVAHDIIEAIALAQAEIAHPIYIYRAERKGVALIMSTDLTIRKVDDHT